MEEITGARPYAAVVGGVNVDIGGHSFQTLNANESNPGRITLSLGGVGRNIAHNLRLLGLDVRFLTALGGDSHADRIEASCAALGIDIRRARRIPGASTSAYLYLSEPGGDMALAVSDMEICRQISPAYIAENLDILQGAQVVIADANLPEETLAFIAQRCAAPVFADPVSAAKAVRLRAHLGRLHTLKPNRNEAELLSGVTIRDGRSLRRAAETLLGTGLRRVFITLGTDGVLAAEDGRMLRLPTFPAHILNATGAGDAFTAALAWAYAEGLDLAETARAASAAAAIAMESTETVNPALSVPALRNKLREFDTRQGDQHE